jgi:hypothetical protein
MCEGTMLTGFKNVFLLVLAALGLTLAGIVIYLLMYFNIGLILAFAIIVVAYSSLVVLLAAFRRGDVLTLTSFMIVVGVFLVACFFVKVPYTGYQTVNVQHRWVLDSGTVLLQANQSELVPAFYFYPSNLLQNNSIIQINVNSTAPLMFYFSSHFDTTPRGPFSPAGETGMINMTVARSVSVFWTPPVNSTVFLDFIFNDTSTQTTIDYNLVAFYRSDDTIIVSSLQPFLDLPFAYAGIAMICSAVGINVAYDVIQSRKTAK